MKRTAARNGWALERRFGEEGDGHVADVSLPLRRQLEEFDIVPLHSVDDN